ncbi:MAG TPA: bifunctional riboflavin kinase/FMN adenylyltransferase, partial [Ruminiclostridium sp.]|nr:bifunctional riboflavin kinase/FMN adenylyltransferase [Ruminiclostridium sp.]
MNILENGIFPDCGKYCGVGLGNFDGLHRGHMALINTLVHKCRLNDLHSVVYTFKKHPENILRKKLFTPLIMTREQKTAILAKIDIDTLYFQEFDEEFSRMTADEFIKDILVEKLRSKLVVVGFDFRFGYMCRGDA